jgi:hypothetical protein
MRLRIIVRGYGDGAKVFEDAVTIEDAAMERVIERMAETHAAALSKYAAHMLEFEFPDAPEDDRFLRFGSDPSRMVMPVAVRL